MEITTYTGSKGDVTLIKDMENPHLIHSIAKLAMKIGKTADSEDNIIAEATLADMGVLKALKAEAINRLASIKE